eukprot:6199238-Pleurochrysis_carterae.AAC.1
MPLLFEAKGRGEPSIPYASRRLLFGQTQRQSTGHAFPPWRSRHRVRAVAFAPSRSRRRVRANLRSDASGHPWARASAETLKAAMAAGAEANGCVAAALLVLRRFCER